VSTTRLILVTLVGTLAMLLSSGAATAGTYTMNQCQAAGSRAVSINWGGWGNLYGGTAYNACGSAGGSFGLGGSLTMDYNTVGGLQVNVPDSRPHVAITHVEADVTTAQERTDPVYCCNHQYSFFRLSAGGQVLFDQEMTGWTQTIGRDVPSTRDFQAGIYCSFGAGAQSCQWTSDPVIALRRVTFTLEESSPPTAQITGGTLLSGGSATGTQTVSYTATDQDSGVLRVSVLIGDTTVGTDQYGESCANDDWNACPVRQDPADMSIDTNQVADGTYPLRLLVTDAAGNTATVDTGRTVTVSNPRANGPGAVRKTSSVQLLVGQGQSRALRTSYGRKLVIAGQATDADGRPLADAVVNVASQIAQAGQDFTGIGQTQTDASGAFAFSVPPGPNRTLRFSYTSPIVAGQQARGQTDVVLQVRAAARLTVSDRKVAGGRRVTFRGRLAGGPVPASGVPIGFRGQVGKHTRKFGDTQTDDRGRFRLTYKMPAAGPRKATYPIWVRIGADGDDYPYLPGLSNRVRVTVLR
jgi:hypothetical protein